VDSSNFASGGALAGYAAAPTLQGSDRTVDSNVSPSGTTPAALPSGGSDATVDFGEVPPASISGTKYKDLTGNGLTSDDTPISGVTINLYSDTNNNGTLDSSDMLVATTTTASNGTYSFGQLTAGTYFVREVVQVGWTPTFPTALSYYTVVVQSGSSMSGENFANFKQTVAPLGKGQTATIGFWKNRGQDVIKSFNGGPTSPALACWLAVNFPNLFGGLAGKTNADVAAAFLAGTSNNYLQAFGVALDIYATTTSLGGASIVQNGLAAKYGFKVTAGGAGPATYNVGTKNAPAFDIPSGQSTTLTVIQILQRPDGHYNSSTGLFYGGDATLNDEANTVLNGVNQSGDIAIVVSGTTGDTATTDLALITALSDLHTGDIWVAVDSLSANQPADEEARIQDAIATLNTDLGALGVNLVEVSGDTAASADIHIQVASTSEIGGMAEGVLGVTTFGGDITVIDGWNWYAGAAAGGIGAGQYDFQTVVTHELGHALGLGHSTDVSSVMFPYLAAASTVRDLTATDLTTIEQAPQNAPEALRALPIESPFSRSLTVRPPAGVAGPTPAFVLATEELFVLSAGTSGLLGVRTDADPEEAGRAPFWISVVAGASGASLAAPGSDMALSPRSGTAGLVVTLGGDMRLKRGSGGRSVDWMMVGLGVIPCVSFGVTDVAFRNVPQEGHADGSAIVKRETASPIPGSAVGNVSGEREAGLCQLDSARQDRAIEWVAQNCFGNGDDRLVSQGASSAAVLDALFIMAALANPKALGTKEVADTDIGVDRSPERMRWLRR
jgi:hypothetical protein